MNRRAIVNPVICFDIETFLIETRIVFEGASEFCFCSAVARSRVISNPVPSELYIIIDSAVPARNRLRQRGQHYIIPMLSETI
ncbi:hypothetical protein Osc7112_2428 [Oscillatoria nigro-viridis PCC 7112]|uniref:Uncharacterized protein n=1 Tax=Phormidium nigroviride PCC 7112 TaxID=179408 RepID=K9VFY5_9CYAN|nr:hypothetical protein Osc7112_2428 [Oscillatoria nigro-viridis PCC 7112]